MHGNGLVQTKIKYEGYCELRKMSQKRFAMDLVVSPKLCSPSLISASWHWQLACQPIYDRSPRRRSIFFSGLTTISCATICRILLPCTYCCEADLDPTAMIQSHRKGCSCRSYLALMVDGMYTNGKNFILKHLQMDCPR